MKTLSNRNAKAAIIIEKVASPIRFQTWPRAKAGNFSVSFPGKEEGTKEKRTAKEITMTVTHACYHVEEKMNDPEIFGEWCLDLDSPIKLWRKTSTATDAKSRPIFADADGKPVARSYNDAKPTLKEMKARLVLNLIGVMPNGQLIHLKLSGMNLSNFYAFSKREALDLSVTPTLTFNYVGATTQPNPQNPSESLFFPNILAEEMTTEQQDAMDEDTLAELTTYIAYKCADAPAPDLSPAEEHLESEAANAKEPTDDPDLNFPPAQANEENGEGGEDLPWD